MARQTQNGEAPPPHPGLEQIESWIFDLDNTLYPVTRQLLLDLDRHMGDFIAGFLNIDRDEAKRVQKNYFRRYGLTMRGLMIHHGLDPTRFYEQMQPMDLTDVDPNPALAVAIRSLPGKKIVYTNASLHHADMVLDRLSMADTFDAIFDIAAADYIPKPETEPYQTLCEMHGVKPSTAVMVDDIARNLEPAADIGMTTVWVKTEAEWAKGQEPAGYIHHVIDDLLAWLSGIVERKRIAPARSPIRPPTR